MHYIVILRDQKLRKTRIIKNAAPFTRNVHLWALNIHGLHTIFEAAYKREQINAIQKVSTNEKIYCAFPIETTA